MGSKTKEAPAGLFYRLMCLYMPPTTILRPTAQPFGQAKGSTCGSCFGGGTSVLTLRTLGSYVTPTFASKRAGA